MKAPFIRLAAALPLAFAGFAPLFTVDNVGAAEPVLELPVDCDMASVCSIQKYVDLDPGPERMDYACGRLSKDGDTGTDFRVPDYPAMDRGVPVLAAAAGVVKAVRDGMADVSVREIGASAIKGREAGNGVVLDHGEGWETQYSHLRRGSVAVRSGDHVAAGQRLGLIGLSGNTEFPHAEFAVRWQGRAVDPFVGAIQTYACGDARRPLWSATALAQLPYRATRPLNAGFAAQRPQPEDARRGAYAAERLPPNSDALVFWADIFGTMAGDIQLIRIDGPDGRLVHEHETVLTDYNISWFAFSGLPRPSSGWKAGSYIGLYQLLRDGRVVVTMTRQLHIDDG